MQVGHFCDDLRTSMTLTLQIQKEGVTEKQRDKFIEQLEEKGWDVNIESEEEEDLALGDNLLGETGSFPGDDMDY
jgi:hypothetical protein